MIYTIHVRIWWDLCHIDVLARAAFDLQHRPNAAYNSDITLDIDELVVQLFAQLPFLFVNLLFVHK